jgi:heme oxygenase (mycobilin-producing)
MAVTLINFFDVPADADEAFLAGWERARDFLAARQGFGATALHRALRPDAEFRFVDVARVEAPEAWREAVADLAFPGRAMPFPGRPALYEIVHEDGAVDDAGGVIPINAFEAPAEADAPFLDGWRRAREALAGQRGYLGTRLHRALRADAALRFVNVARWSSPLMFSRAVGRPEFREVSAAMPFASHTALYQVVRR